MTTQKNHFHKVIKPLVGSIAALLLGTSVGHAGPMGGSATWNANPVDGDYGNSSNWTPNTVPNTPADTAFFNKSSITNIGLPIFTGTEINGMVFNSGASAYNFTVSDAGLLFTGAGVVNNSSNTQNFFVGPTGAIIFENKSNAGKNTIFTALGSQDGGEGGGTLEFDNSSSAGQATLVATGGVLTNSFKGPFLIPFGFSTGGGIFFYDDSQGGQASVKLYGNGFLDISGHNPGSVTIGSLEGNGIVTLGSNNLTVGSNNKSTVFYGSIQDGGEGFFPNVRGVNVPFPFFNTGGSLTKIGSGTLTLAGSNSYTGNTIIDGGTLIVDGSIASPFTFVNPGGTLGGHGWIGGAVINNGLVSPGNSPGTLSIQGNYSQTSGGGLLIQVASPNVYDHLVVGGTATLGGTLIVDGLNPTDIKKGQKFDFLTAGGGIYGTFGNIEIADNGTLLHFKVKYGSHDVSLESFFAPFTSVDGLTPNQESVAKNLDRAMNSHRASKLINFLGTQQISRLPGDFDKIAPEEYTSIFTLGESFDNVQSLNLQRRTDNIRSGATGFSAAGLAMNGYNPSFDGPIQFRTGTAGPNGDDGKSSKEVKQVAPEESRWGAFLTGTGEWVGVGDDFNAKGYDIASGGFTLGVDYKVCPHFAVGVMAGYVGTTVDTNDGGRVRANGGKLGLYATAYQNRQPAAPASTGMSKDSSKESKEVIAPVEVDPGWYADLAVVGGYSGYDVHRSALNGTARGDTNGGDLNVLFGAGYDFKRGGFTFGPTASFNYTYVGVGDFTETGSLAPLHFGSQGQESIRTALGMKASYDWKVGGLLIKPEVRAAWQHEYGDAAYEIDSSFANGAGSTFTVNGPRIGRDSLLVGAGFAIQINDRLSTYFYYDGELGRTRYDSHNVTGGVRLAF